MEIRELRGAEEYRAAEALQRLVWGDDFDLVPAHLVLICQQLGGVGAGAFSEAGELLGFVFGITGISDGEPVHWSDILAVRPEARGLGIGRRLKEHQRERVRAIGVRTMRWTFDPLIARNAHLNLNRLGARVDEYVPEMYAESASPLHQGLGMDRLVVSWEMEGDGLALDRPSHAPPEEVPAINMLADGTPYVLEGHPRTPQIRISIPTDIHSVRDRSPDLAVLWRKSTRAAFLAAQEAGYRVTGYEGGAYLLERSGSL